jgi:hypothetical protein
MNLLRKCCCEDPIPHGCCGTGIMIANRDWWAGSPSSPYLWLADKADPGYNLVFNSEFFYIYYHLPIQSDIDVPCGTFKIPIPAFSFSFNPVTYFTGDNCCISSPTGLTVSLKLIHTWRRRYFTTNCENPPCEPISPECAGNSVAYTEFLWGRDLCGYRHVIDSQIQEDGCGGVTIYGPEYDFSIYVPVTTWECYDHWVQPLVRISGYCPP